MELATADKSAANDTTDSQENIAPLRKVANSTALGENAPQVQHWRRKNLFLEIPTRKIEISQDSIAIKMPPTATPTPKRVSFMLTPSSADARVSESPGPSSSGTPSLRNLLPKFNFKNRSSLDVEKATNIATAAPCTTPQGRSCISRTLPLTKIFTPRTNKASSLPATPSTHLNPESVHCGIKTGGSFHAYTKEAECHIARSLSVPTIMKERCMRRTDAFIRVVPSPRVKERDITSSNTDTPMSSENKEPEGEDISEEEAVCRICFVELCEGGETLKMECCCKGELALAHQDCALKWFSLKGNKTCDICKREVQNLPVTLLRIQTSRAQNTTSTRADDILLNGYSICEEVPVLVIVSMLGYFCLLEQLLVAKMGTGAIAISLPFACAMGLISSMTSSSMVKRRFIWVYASIQSALVVIFVHVFYSLVHLQVVISILLATFVGFGAAMLGSSMLVEFLRWRSRRGDAQSDRQQPNSANIPWVGFPNHRPTVVQNPETFSEC
ncbi:hypothetical protein Ancab_008308 [Ancistrocladus abbreviatus]